MSISILHLVGDSKFGGGSQIVGKLAELGQEMGWQADVLATDSVFRQFLSDRHIRSIPFNAIYRSIHPIWDTWGLIRLIRFFRKKTYTIVHTHTSKAGFLGRIAARLAGIPVVIHTIHGFAFHEDSSPLTIAAFSTLERVAARFCDMNVTVSHFHRQWALDLHIATPSTLQAIPNGISGKNLISKRPAGEIKQCFGLAADEFILVNVGRLAREKGIEFLLQAVVTLKERLTRPWRLLIVGDGPHKEILHSLAQRLGVEKHVIFVGFTPDVGDFFSIADGVILPSYREGLSISLLEAMGSGKPIVATNIGSNREATQDGHSAILVPPRDPVALMEAIVRLVENDEMARQLGAKARDRFLQQYTEDLMARNYQKLYQSLLAKLK